MKRAHRLGVFVVIVSIAFAIAGLRGEPQADPGARALVGTIDIHVHHLPDDRARSIDAIDVAKLASERKMRGLVLKNHYESTAGIAFLVRKMVPGI